MSDSWSHDIDDLQTRLGGLIDRTELGDDARELASESLEELAVVIEELQSQNSELVASRASLDDERRRYRDLFDTVPDAYVITDSDGIITEANKTTCAAFERPLSRIVGKPLSTFIEASDQRAFYGQLNRIRDAGAGAHFTINLALRDGVSIAANLRATRGESHSDGHADIRWLIHDRRDELVTAELRLGEERLRALFDTAAVGIILCDEQGELLFINQFADRILERQPTDSTMSQWLRTTHAGDRDRMEAILRRAADPGISGSMRHRLVHADDTVSWVDHSVAPFRNAAGSVTGFVSTIVDITTEHVATADLHDSLDFTAALLDTVGALVIVIDGEGTILRFNKTCESTTGFRADDVIGRPFVTTLVPVEQRDGVSAVFDRLAAPATNSFENDWITADGRRRRIAWNNTSLIGPDGRTRAIIGTGIDITDERLLRSRLEQTDRLESIGRLTAGIAHDFNNTLTTLRLRLDRLAARGLDKESCSDLAAAEETIDRTQLLIADLVSFSSRQELIPAPLDVNDALTRTAEVLADLLGDSITTRIHLTAEDTTASIDPGRFEQIITNLVLNAKDAMPDGGLITITTSIDLHESGADPQLAPGEYVRISVADTGIGIDSGQLGQIFDPYFTTKPPARGAGLGLATTYGTVNQSGGAIVVDSDPGRGTSLTIWLPRLSTAASGHQAPPSRDDTTTGLALVVDDDREVLNTLVSELERLGYRTLAADTGTAALAHLGTTLDLLITDVQLPDINGVDIADRFKARHAALPIVFTSGALPALLDTLVPHDALILHKPFTIAELVAVIAV